MTLYAHAAKFGPIALWQRNPSTGAITIPATINVYAVGTTTRATLYTDDSRGSTAPNNPVSTGVAVNLAGVDTQGNLIFYAEADDYDVVADGQRQTVRAIPRNSDVQSSAGGFDPSTYVNF